MSTDNARRKNHCRVCMKSPGLRLRSEEVYGLCQARLGGFGAPRTADTVRAALQLSGLVVHGALVLRVVTLKSHHA